MERGALSIPKKDIWKRGAFASQILYLPSKFYPFGYPILIMDIPY
jgi:hypothetical protein